MVDASVLSTSMYLFRSVDSSGALGQDFGVILVAFCLLYEYTIHVNLLQSTFLSYFPWKCFLYSSES